MQCAVYMKRLMKRIEIKFQWTKLRLWSNSMNKNCDGPRVFSSFFSINIVIQRRHNTTLSRQSETMLTLLLTLAYKNTRLKVSFFAIFDYRWRILVMLMVSIFFACFCICMHFVGVYQKEYSVCHLLGRSTHWLGANIQRKFRTVRERATNLKGKRERERRVHFFWLVYICV